MRKHIYKVKSHIIAHKIISSVVLITILALTYWGYNKLTSTAGYARYITAKVQKGSIVASVSGSGQVSALSQVGIKSKVSGDVVYLPKQNGDMVSQGTLIAQLDTRDMQKSVRDAEINLESSKISLDKLKIEKSKENMNADLAKSYDDGFNIVSSVFLDLPGIMTGLKDIFFKSNSGTGQWNVDWYQGQVINSDLEKVVIFKQNFIDSYNTALKAYDASFENYKIISRTSDNATIEMLILQTYDTTKLISDTIKNANNYVDFVNSSIQKNNADTPAIITTHKTSLSSYTSKTNSHLLNLLSTTTSIKSYKDAFLSSDLDIQSAILIVRQRENSLQDTKDRLADYFIRAPFDGTITKINIKNKDTVSAGSVVATLITKKQLAEISLNEVDVAKIKVGQKTTLIFDAIPDLSISGIVADIDAIGTVEQGVVTYIVKISFDTQDERVKSGMSVSTTIVTDTRENVLVVPNSAIKSQAGGNNYVEMFDTSLSPSNDGTVGSISKIAPKKIRVVVGLSSDKGSEIIGGVKEGDEIITRTIQGGATTTTAAPSIFGNTGGNRAR